MRKSVLWVLATVLAVCLAGCVHTSGTTSTGSPLASPVASRILERGELNVGMAGDMPPLNMTNKDGKVIGMEPDLAKSMASAMGVKLTIKTMNFPDLLPALAKGEVDMVMSGMTITPKRNLKTAFVGPYYESGKSLLTKTDTFADIEDAEVLNSPDTTLAALENSTSQEWVEKILPKAKLIKAKNYEQAVDLILKGQADALIADFPICLVTVFRYPEENLMALGTPLSYEPIGVAVSGNDHLMINWLENYLKIAKAAGYLDKLEEKWFQDDFWLDELP